MIPRLSIIIPAYNMEKYLPDAVKSVREQTFSDWELILVDDGSSDSTPRLCDEAAASDKRIHAVHRKNGGLSAARNSGLDNASGEYVAFLDADDILSPAFCEIMTKCAVAKNMDIVNSSYIEFSNIPPEKFFNKKPEYIAATIAGCSVIPARLAVARTLYQRHAMVPSVCTKIFKRTIFDKIRFREGSWYEDLDIFYRLYLSTDEVGVVNTPLYGYRQQAESFIHTFSRGRYEALDVTDRMFDWIGRNSPTLLPAARDRRMSAHFNILLLIMRNWKQIKKMAAESGDNTLLEEAKYMKTRCKNVIRAQRAASLRNPLVRPKNRIGALLSYLFF